MDIQNIKILLNQWKKQTNFKSLIHSVSSDKYKSYDQKTKISISILGIFSTFDIIFSRQFKEGNYFSILNILGIISVIIITTLATFEIHMKYPDKAEHHHVLAILYSQINRKINSFLIKNGNITRDEVIHFYNDIQEQIYLIGTMDCECSQKIEDKIEKQMKKNFININTNTILINKKKNKYTLEQINFINNLSVTDLQNIIQTFCKNENINFYVFDNITEKKALINIAQIDLNISFENFQKIFKNNVVINIQNNLSEQRENHQSSISLYSQKNLFFKKKMPIINMINILCIDDDPVHNKILKNVLAKKNWNVECFCSPKEGFEKFLLKKYDLIIVDYKMPLIDGRQFTNMIRNSNNINKNVIIIGMSAYDDENISKNCIEYGMNDFISKPIIKSKLHLITKYL